MATVLCISSEVVRGHVGNSAARFVLQRLGHQVWALPTIILANHPGHRHTAGTRTDPAQLLSMLDAIDANGWLGEVDAVLTGYLPTADHVEMARTAIERVRAVRPDAPIVCDPVLGDDPGGLYIEASAAAAVRDRLIPMADIATPNRFELHWLSTAPVDQVQQAVTAARRLGPSLVLATSIPDSAGATLHNMLVGPRTIDTEAVSRQSAVPHGTGDMLAALFLGHLLHGALPAQALKAAVGGVATAIRFSDGKAELDLVGSQAQWAEAFQT
jgi:pyridoxine kinase